MKKKAKNSTVEQINAAKAALHEFRKTMTFVVVLTEAERREHRHARLGGKKLRLVENRLVAARQHQDLLPPKFDLAQFEKDAAETFALSEFLAELDAIYTDITDTLLAVGNRATVAAATAYGHIRVGSTTAERLKRTVQKLTVRHERTEPTPIVPTVVSAASSAAAPAVVPIPAEQTGSTVDPTTKAA